MRLVHVALVRRSQTESDAFFQGLLGLEKTRTKTVPAQVCEPLFGVARDLEAIDYAGGPLRFEVFLLDDLESRRRRVEHVCIEVEDAAELLERCQMAGLEVRRARRGERTVAFVDDGDGNLFEIAGAP